MNVFWKITFIGYDQRQEYMRMPKIASIGKLTNLERESDK